MLAGWLGIVGQRYRSMTFVHVVQLLVELWRCMYQAHCLVAELVMREVGRFHSHHWTGKWVLFPFPDLHRW